MDSKISSSSKDRPDDRIGQESQHRLRSEIDFPNAVLARVCNTHLIVEECDSVQVRERLVT